MVGFGCGVILTHPRPLLVWNASASAPIGLYHVVYGVPLHRSELVLAWAPDWARELANRRGYLPRNVPLVKRIAAMTGDTICADQNTIFINGHAVTQQFKIDREGRALPGWSRCTRLNSDDVFLLMKGVPASFDGRYFGPVKTSAIIAELVPLWTS